MCSSLSLPLLITQTRVQDHYLSLSAASRRRLLYRLASLPLPCKARVQEAVADQIFSAEVVRAGGDLDRAYRGLRDSCGADDDPSLFAWMASLVDRGLGHRVRARLRWGLRLAQDALNLTPAGPDQERIQIKLSFIDCVAIKKKSYYGIQYTTNCSLNSHLELNLLNFLAPQVSSCAPAVVVALRRLVMFYLDVLKDIALVLVVGHISEYILLGHFDTVGGINLDYLRCLKLVKIQQYCVQSMKTCLNGMFSVHFCRYYLIGVVVSSQVALFAQSLFNLDELKIYSSGGGRSGDKRIRALAVLFPVHFVLFEQVIT